MLAQIILRDKFNLPTFHTQAEIFGNLAIHPAVESGRDFTVSHIPTGLAVARDLDEGAARRVASALCAQFDWSFQSKRDAQPIKALVRATIANVIAPR